MASVLAGFVLLLELALQVVVPLFYRPRFTKLDPIVGWYHHASISTMSTLEGHKYRESYNSHGYRPPDHSYDKPAGTRRVVVLGDSFVDGSEVGDEELFTWLLQESTPDTEVINLGVYGYSTAQQLLTLEHAGLRYDPDVVVVVTMSNDFTGNALNFNFFGPAPRFVLSGDTLLFEPTTGAAARAAFRTTNLPVPGMRFLHEHSLVYYFLNHFIYQRLAAKRIADLNAAQIQALSRAERVELYRRLMRRIKRLCDERGSELVVVLGYQANELHPDRDSPSAAIRQALESEGIRSEDLYRPLRDAEFAADSSLYYRTDIHWNVRGHRLVAQLLAPIIRPASDRAVVGAEPGAR